MREHCSIGRFKTFEAKFRSLHGSIDREVVSKPVHDECKTAGGQRNAVIQSRNEHLTLAGDGRDLKFTRNISNSPRPFDFGYHRLAIDDFRFLRHSRDYAQYNLLWCVI